MAEINHPTGNNQLDLKKLYQELLTIIDCVGRHKILEKNILGKSTLWKWENQANLQPPKIESLRKVLREHSGLNNFFDFFNHYDGEIKRYIGLTFSLDNKFLDLNYNAIDDLYDAYALTMASMEGGISEAALTKELSLLLFKSSQISTCVPNDSITAAFESIATIKLDKLLKNEVIKKIEDRLYFNENGFFIDSDKLHLLIKQFEAYLPSRDLWYKQMSHSYTFAANIPKWVAKEVNKKALNVYKENVKLMKEHASADSENIQYQISSLSELLNFSSNHINLSE